MIDDGLQIFADEAEDLLEVAEQALLNLDNLDSSEDTLEGINDLFRTFHTIKGSAGLFGFDYVVDFTHIVESVLVKIREGELQVDEEMVSLFLNSRDHLDELIQSAVNGAEALSSDLENNNKKLSEQLSCYLGVSTTEVFEAKNSMVTGEIEWVDDEPEETETTTNFPGKEVVNENWHVSLRFGPGALRNGMEPASFTN